MTLPETTDDYDAWLASLKATVRSSQGRAGLLANAAMITLNWRIGREILVKQQTQGWGAKVIPRLSEDLGKEFGTRGYSPRNLKYMRDFAEAWPDPSILQQAAAKLPWGHHQLLLDKLPRHAPMHFYVERAVEEAWSRNVLRHMVETLLHAREGSAINNFARTMAPERAPFAIQFFKDPYVLNFVGADNYAHERHLQASLLLRIKDLLVELGQGFSFYGGNYRLTVGGDEYWLDLIFYHTKLHSYVVVELKMDAFKPEYAGKMGFYLAVVDDLIRDKEVDHPSIGLILCRGKNDLAVTYTLGNQDRPMAVSDYAVLPASYAEMLPSAEVLNRHLGDLYREAIAESRHTIEARGQDAVSVVATKKEDNALGDDVGEDYDSPRP